MTRWFLAAALAASLVAQAAVSAAEVGLNQPVSTTLSVNGTSCGTVRNWRGGDMRIATRAAVASGGTGYATVGAEVRCAPLSFEIQFPAPAPLTKLIQDMCAGVQTRATLVLTDMTTATPPAPAMAFEVTHAILSEVRFPAMPTTGRDPVFVTLVFLGSSSRTIEPPASVTTPPEIARKLPTAVVRLEIPGIDARGFALFEPFTITRETTEIVVGGDRFQTSTTPGRTKISPLISSMGLSMARDFSRWRDDAVKANSPLPRDGTLTFLDTAMKPLAILRLSGVGMGGVGVVPIASSGLRRMQVELSCEGVRLDVPPPPPPASATTRGA